VIRAGTLFQFRTEGLIMKVKRILITGAGSGFGELAAIGLARAGHDVIAGVQIWPQATALRRKVEALGLKTLRVEKLDLLHPYDVQNALNWAIDILVNNAGVGARGKFETAVPERLRQIMEVNFFAPVEMMRLALPLLRRGNRPIIANVSSVLGHRAVPNKSEYCASKFALHGFSDSLRAELAPQGIDVLLVSPSTTTSEFFQVAAGASARSPERFSSMTAGAVARRAVAAIAAGRHEIILSPGGKLLVWLDRLFPSLMDRLIARYA